MPRDNRAPKVVFTRHASSVSTRGPDVPRPSIPTGIRVRTYETIKGYSKDGE